MSRYQVNPRFSWKKLAAGCVILDLEKGSYFTLNETATCIWTELAGGKPLAEIAASLAAEYDVPVAQAAADVDETLALLAKEGVVAKC
jgi:hypothetical protein